MTTLFSVLCPPFEYNDEGYYPGEGAETLAVCQTRKDAEFWVSKNGWNHISYAMLDPSDWVFEEYGDEGSSWGEEIDWTPEKRARAVKEFISISETPVFKAGK